jgi:hypothetical protein
MGFSPRCRALRSKHLPRTLCASAIVSSQLGRGNRCRRVATPRPEPPSGGGFKVLTFSYGWAGEIVWKRSAVQLTVLFTNMVGFTTFLEQAGEEAAFTLMQTLAKLME